MKKSIAFLLIFITTFMLTSNMMVDCKDSNETNKENSVDSLSIGDYILLGMYYDRPILWHYVANDENGMLMLSDKALCFKNFGLTNFWADSALRKWLNSDVSEGGAEWNAPPINNHNYNSNTMEKGFLNKDNFTSRERTTMKSIIQWTMLPAEHLDLSENEETKAYSNIKKNVYSGSPPEAVCYSISELKEVYSGAAHKTEDTVFLLDEMQIYSMWENFGSDHKKLLTTVITEAYVSPPVFYPNGVSYYLRTPSDQNNISSISGGGEYSTYHSAYPVGIRPAFYLNTNTAKILSGSGTENDPYVIDGKEEIPSVQVPEGDISVFINGTRLEFDQPPIMENDRVLVPMRFIFESLGSVVTWEEETKTVTAVKGDTKIALQIGSDILYKNGEEIKLDVPAKLFNSRTLVPIRAVSESLEAVVDWNEKENAVIINFE